MSFQSNVGVGVDSLLPLTVFLSFCIAKRVDAQAERSGSHHGWVPSFF